jgi:hypothetical protein
LQVAVFLWLDVLTKLSIVDIAMMILFFGHTVLVLLGGPASDDATATTKCRTIWYALSLVIVL